METLDAADSCKLLLSLSVIGTKRSEEIDFGLIATSRTTPSSLALPDPFTAGDRDFDGIPAGVCFFFLPRPLPVVTDLPGTIGGFD